MKSQQKRSKLVLSVGWGRCEGFLHGISMEKPRGISPAGNPSHREKVLGGMAVTEQGWGEKNVKKFQLKYSRSCSTSKPLGKWNWNSLKQLENSAREQLEASSGIGLDLHLSDVSLLKSQTSPGMRLEWEYQVQNVNKSKRNIPIFPGQDFSKLSSPGNPKGDGIQETWNNLCCSRDRSGPFKQC